MWDNIVQIIIIAAISEAVWETLKMVWQQGKFQIDKVGALAISLLVAFGAGLDLVAFVGIPMVIPYLGIVLTGILISRGAGFIHDLLTNFKSLKEIITAKKGTAVTDSIIKTCNELNITTPTVPTDAVDPLKKAVAGLQDLARDSEKAIKIIRTSANGTVESKTEPKEE